MKHYIPLALLLTTIFLQPALTLGQDNTSPGPAKDSGIEAEIKETPSQLEQTYTTIQSLETEIATTKKQLKRETDEKTRDDIQQYLDEQTSRLKMLEHNFIEIASEINVPEHESIQELKKLSWGEELNEIVTPVLIELKTLINEPRQLDRLQSEIDQLRQRKLSLTEGIANIDAKIEAEGANRKLKTYLTDIKKNWLEDLSDTNTQLTIASQRLDTKLKNKKSFASTIEQLFQIFFKKRGRNFLITLLSCILFWVLSGKLCNSILTRTLSRTKKQASRQRVIEVLLNLVRILCTAALMLGLFYLLSDWLLLVLGLMVLLGVAWASKSTLPLVWKQITYFMNLGSVKEGERLIYNGLPWRVAKLYYYSKLENPLLKGGVIRLPLRELTSMTSRPYDKDEPWFPTKDHDWILIDQKPWKVVFQSPEIVRILQPGGAWQTFSTPEFFLMNPTVISKGFRITRTFGIDYQYQEECTEQCVQLLLEGIQKRFREDGFDEDAVSIFVEFEEAAGSSLNFAVLIDCDGELASRYMKLYRLIHKYCVDVCNEHQWVIPFEQLTLHYEGPQATAEETANQ